MLAVFQIALGIDFQWIWERFWCQVGRQNGAKIEIFGGWKNDIKNDDDQDVKKLEKGAYGTIRHHRFGARGGGRRRAKPLLQYSKKHWMKELGDGCWHARPKPPDAQRAGGISIQVFDSLQQISCPLF